jgi:ubiquinone/menaquinone biosynthesis C-methylase UbiE
MIESPPLELTPHAELPGTDSYAAWAQSYDAEPDNRVIAAEESVIWEMIGAPEGLRVLDVGCGTGRHAVRLARQGSHVTGTDPTAEMLAKARRKLEAEGLEADLRQGDIEDLAAEPRQFDVVLCCLVLSHLADLDAAIARLGERVQPGGRLILSDFHPFQLLIGFRTTYRCDGRKYVVPNYVHLPSEYCDAIKSAGLAITSLKETGSLPGFPGMPLTIVIEARKPPPSCA